MFCDKWHDEFHRKFNKDTKGSIDMKYFNMW